MKLLEYFAAGKAVVSTPLGAEGLDVQDGRELVLAEPSAFVDRVLALLDAPEERRRLGSAAREHARARDWSEIGAAYQRIHRGTPADFVARPSIEAHLPPRTPSKPLTLLLLVNRGCNLRCSFCDLYERPQRMPVDKAVALLDEAVRIGTRTLVVTGGEPTLHPGLPEIVRAAKTRGLGVNITTNGTLLDRHYAPLVAAGLDSLSVSIDGLPDTHDRIRGQRGAHDKAWEQLVRVVRDGRVQASVYFTVTRENVRELVAVWERVRELGARFDFWPVNDAPEQALVSEPDRAAWRAAVARIAEQDAEVAARAHYYDEALRYHAGEKASMRCLGLVDQYGVTYTGDLLPCCVWGGHGLKAGNVFKTPLSELWTSPAVQARRERMFGSGCEAGCYNHSLYEFTASTGLSHRVDGRGES
jgi:MoaA/NifB/PqqE/SkfB family radical SAM enzyme